MTLWADRAKAQWPVSWRSKVSRPREQWACVMLYSCGNEAVGDVHAHNEGLRVGETLRGERGGQWGKDGRVVGAIWPRYLNFFYRRMNWEGEKTVRVNR